jgi:cell division protein FtsL
MGPGETIAALAFAGVLIAVVCVLCSVFVRWISYKQRKMELEAEARNTARQTHKDDYVELLEERVRVLERIATDRGQDIAHQIESLRNRQTAEKI